MHSVASISGRGVATPSCGGVRTAQVLPSRNRRVIRVHAASDDDGNPLSKLFKAPPKRGENLEDRIASGEFTDSGSTKEKITRPIRKALASDPTGLGRWVALQLAKQGQAWRAAAAQRMPEARGDIREIVGQPVFVPLYKLFLVYGKIFRLSFGPKSFVIISDPGYARQILMTNAEKYSKGLLSEILDFVMGTGLIPADGEIWRVRRRAIVPALHKRYVESMVGMFNNCVLHGTKTLDRSIALGQPMNMENFFSRLGLDIIGKAVFNYEFDSLAHDDPVIEAVYVLLREAEHRSTAPIPYWDLPGAKVLVPRQRKCVEALKMVNECLDGLIAKCKQLVEDEDEAFVDEFLSEKDPSILHFLIASGDEISSKQLRDDLMTMLIAGHETTAAVLTWTMFCLVQNPAAMNKVLEEVDAVIADRTPGIDDIKALTYTRMCLGESLRLYPQPPLLIRRALGEDTLPAGLNGDPAGYPIGKGADLFISVWNLHRSPHLWRDPDVFRPERYAETYTNDAFGGKWAGYQPSASPGALYPNEVTSDFAFIPFGGGARKCIGDQFALFEATVALAMLLRRYTFSLAVPAEKVGMATGATIHTANGLPMKVVRRVAPASGSAPPKVAAGVA
uniref:Cytochrome P450 n=1 Tax=Chlamydomonas leiostraca TaxID=1034604 RepID=A0A7S0RBW3_9CHLO|mmetsp:Transcript_18964/g.48145  ORF Transcript_18964/g.48145 Transcript_18964/m.48145 type:complete len:620 (+) Transcript_18964:125-1984(+)